MLNVRSRTDASSGIFLGFSVSVAAYGQWRLILASAMVPVVPLFVLIYLCPESPRFLIRKNEYKKAYNSLRRFRRTEIQACRDLYFIHSQLQKDTTVSRHDPEDSSRWYEHEFYQDEVKDMHYLQRVYRLVTRKRNLRASVSACLCILTQQLCGVSLATQRRALLANPHFRSMCLRSTRLAFMEQPPPMR